MQQLAKELEILDGRIKPLEDTRRAFQMAIQAMMSTILEAAEAPEDENYTLSADLKRLLRVEKEG